MQHPAVDQKLRNVSGIGSTVTVGWARACTRAQNALNKSQPATTLPTLLLTTPGDSVLQTDELQQMVSGFSSDAKIKSVESAVTTCSSRTTRRRTRRWSTR